MNKSLKIKIVVIFVLLSLSVSIISLSLIYTQNTKFQIRDLKASLLMTATLGAEIIDGDEHNKIELNRAAINTSVYQKIKQQLVKIQAANPKIRYVYTIKKAPNDSRLFFVVDSVDVEEIFMYPGDSYESLSQNKVLLSFQKPQVNDSLIKDDWGSYMSGYAPIKDSQGNVVAALGLDMVGDTIFQVQKGIFFNLSVIFIVSVLLSLILGIGFALKLMKPINNLLDATKKIAGGDLDYKVPVYRRDEIGKLAESFNKMSVALKESNKNVRKSFFDTIKSLSIALEAKDPYTKGHSERVMEYGVAIARELGVDNEEIEILQYLYIMHDIGKIGVTESVLNKPGTLSGKERQMICEHSRIGAEILAPISFLDDKMMQIVRSHHEYQDGSGYPEGLTGEQIPLAVAILTVADSYDAMITDRPYRKAISGAKARQELIDNSEIQFKKEVVEAFLKVLDKKEFSLGGNFGTE